MRENPHELRKSLIAIAIATIVYVVANIYLAEAMR